MITNNSANIRCSNDEKPLDTYDYNTHWAPIIKGSSVAGVGNYSLNSGFYCMIGQIVLIQCSLIWSSHSGSGDILVSMPFPCDSQLNYAPQGIVSTVNISLPPASNPTTLCSIQPAHSVCNIFCSNKHGNNSNVQLSSSGELRFSIFYLI